jgi:hypothetical protein
MQNRECEMQNWQTLNFHSAFFILGFAFCIPRTSFDGVAVGSALNDGEGCE